MSSSKSALMSIVGPFESAGLTTVSSGPSSSFVWNQDKRVDKNGQRKVVRIKYHKFAAL